jgi:hypothetical protein
MVANLELELAFELSQRATKSEGELRKATATTNQLTKGYPQEM